MDLNFGFEDGGEDAGATVGAGPAEQTERTEPTEPSAGADPVTPSPASNDLLDMFGNVLAVGDVVLTAVTGPTLRVCVVTSTTPLRIRSMEKTFIPSRWRCMGPVLSRNAANMAKYTMNYPITILQ